MSPRRTLLKILFIALPVLVLGTGVFYYERLVQIVAPRPKVEALMSQATIEAAQGNYLKAVRVFQAVPQQYPDSEAAPQALMEAAEIFDLYLDRPYEAVHAYLLVIRDYPLATIAVNARKNIADIYKNRLRDYEQASVYYQRVLEGDFIRKDIIQYELADCYFRLNNFEQSRIELETFLVNYPNSPLVPETRFRIATAFALEDNFARAEEVFRALIKDFPENPLTLEARFEIGSLLARQEKLAKALETFRELRGKYSREEVLNRKIERIEERIRKKKKAI